MNTDHAHDTETCTRHARRAAFESTGYQQAPHDRGIPTESQPDVRHTTWAEWVDSREWCGSSDTAMPMLPALAPDIMSLVLDPDVSVLRIAHIISKDQVLATRVLRLANSAYCAPMQEVTTINNAIVRMGTAAARNVVLAVSLTSRMQGQDTYGSAGRQLVDHSIGTAYLARIVGERAGVNPDEAFVYGLLHDIGKLVLLKLERDFVRFGGRAPEGHEVDRLIAERHAELGAELMEQWRLPAELREPVRFHHEPSRSGDFSTQATVAYVADRLSHRYGFGCTPHRDDTLVVDPLWHELGLTPSYLADLDRRAPGLFEVARQIA